MACRFFVAKISKNAAFIFNDDEKRDRHHWLYIGFDNKLSRTKRTSKGDKGQIREANCPNGKNPLFAIAG